MRLLKTYQKHIHIINPQGLGDLVMMFPLLRHLSETSPQKISLSVKSQAEADIVQLFFPSIRSKDIICVSPFKTSLNPIAGFIKYIRSIQKLSPEIVLSCFSVHPMLASLTAFLSMANVRIGFKSRWDFLNTTTVELESEKHKVFQYLKLLEPLTGKLKKEHLFCSFTIHPDPWKIVTDLLKKHNVSITTDRIIGIAPGSGDAEKHKRWPWEKYAALIDHILTHSNVCVVIMGSSQERSLSENIVKSLQNKRSVVDLTGKTSIIETVHLLRLCHVIVANCNGLSHLAGAVGTKVIGLYGPTDPFFTGVFSSDVTIIRKEMHCAPCYCRENITGCDHPTCMTDISVSEVTEAVTKVLSW
ncbi:MAG: lipopolysaccharide heptosyltransferase II [Candidatus Magnetomorum sp.]|nr:lipopolysaccharide heptosyltransferase II [Candidatus Magnetomorum sp.]